MKNIITKIDRQALALCIARLALGTIFVLHGSQKVFGLFGGPGLNGFASWAANYGIAPIWAYSAAFAELIGGILLLTGICAELGALLTIPVMLGAVLLIHWKSGYFAQNGGFEYPLNLIFFAIVVIIGGPGMGSLYNCFKRKNN